MAGMDFLVSALLNAAGLDQDKIKEVAAKLASDDTVNKVLAFSAGLERQNQLLKEIRDELRSKREVKPDPDFGSNRPSEITGEPVYIGPLSVLGTTGTY